jgi:multimeric flavodoxin WrbA/putative sterol carrier protein
MRIVIVRGSPRKDGHTRYITDLVAQGARDAGAHIDDIDLYTKKVNRCSGCYRCWTVTPGTCIHNDDMTGLITMLYAADILLLSTPLYNYTMSSICKQFIERLLPWTGPESAPADNGLFRNRIRDPEKWGVKKLAVASACAFKSMDNFNALLETCTLIAHSIHMTWIGGILRPESHLLPFTVSKPKTTKIIESALVQCGRELAVHGILPQELLDAAATPLSFDNAHFQNYSKIYWEEVSALGQEGTNLKKVQSITVRDVRILMHEMARNINPRTTANMKAVLRFHFTDKNLYYNLTINKGACTLEEKESHHCDLSITTDSVTWGKLLTRELSARNALMEKKIVLEGDKNIFIRLERYFPPPSG